MTTTKDQMKDLFEQAYDRGRWLRILAEHLQIDQFSQPLSLEGEGEARAVYQLGHVVLADDKKLGIYEIHTKPETRLHRNRVQMRQLVAKHCQQSALDGALAVYDDKNGHWRFSFISMEYRFNEQGQLNRRESAPKRYTYLFGKDAKVRTAVERFSLLKKTATPDDIKTAFAVEPLNKEFYEKLFTWYERAKAQVTFPNDEREEKDTHVSTSLIRLLTRLLFVWFLKEKGLVNREFFEPERVRQLIDWDKQSGYYKAILQNLFFATLNREIKDRTFRTTTNGKPNSNNYLVPNVYRYQDVFSGRTRAAIVQLFERTPFLNGGLFECLDRDATEEEQRAYEKDGTIRNERLAIRVDGFSDRADNVLAVPNDLFFNEDEPHLGLVTLLNRYQFTVEERTPLDADVALDPELLGLVFENLLASYNPETRQTARQASGSYYTPREIVNYMVDESVQAYLAQATNVDGKKITRLFMPPASEQGQTAGTESERTEDETAAIIQAIDAIKIIDPAVGSGAFPMGILQRLVHILGTIDPKNTQWKQRQTDVIDTLPDPESREQALKELDRIFSEDNRFNDFSRKLYLIEKCIYGVDVQPIACQIAKLRFFISLAIEQEPNSNAADNYGIKPLPNLETKFVAADTLLGLDKPDQLTLGQTDAVTRLEQELNTNRERHFRATTRRTKEKYRKRDKTLRNELAAELKRAGFPAADADKITRWDPYDQNAKADWFDPEYMFGVKNGFNLVIGNPPYIQLQKNDGTLGNRYKGAGFQTFARTGDVYQLFYEKGCQLLTPERGLLAYVTSNSWLKAEYGKTTRRYFSEHHTPLQLLDVGKDVFEHAIVDVNVLIMRHGKPSAWQPDGQETPKAVDMDRLSDTTFPPAVSLWGTFRPRGNKPWNILSPVEWNVMDKMEAAGTPLKHWEVKINYGIKTGYNPAFIIEDPTRQALIAEDPNSAKILKPVLRGRDIKRYQAQWANLWLIDTHNGYGDVSPISIDEYPAVKRHLDGFYTQLARRQDQGRTPYNLRNCAYHEDFSKEKLFWMQMSAIGRFAYSNSEIYCNQKAFILTGTSLKYLCAILNSTLVSWLIKNVAVTTGMGLTQWDKFTVETIPVPNVSATEQRPFIRLVDRILSAKASDPSADVTELEKELDRLVYNLYGLTAEEIAMFEEPH